MKKRTTILAGLALTGLLFTGCATQQAQVSRIDLETAKATAIEAAGFSEEEVSFLSAELDQRNGIEYYDVDFTADGKEYDYDIDALTGTVIGSESPENADDDQGNSSNTSDSSSLEISEAEAKEIALAQVPGASESDIREFKVDYDDGRLEYDGTIHYEEMEYEFEIDGYSGAIRSWDVESIYD